MIIKSHVRGNYRTAALYLEAQGHNEKIRTVDISDFDAVNLKEAFQNMQKIAKYANADKTLHHISINPCKDERLTDTQLLKIVERCEQKYGYKPNDHQRVIVEHIKEGRQHFHVMWNRIRLSTGSPAAPGLHWHKSKQAAREMERELGLKAPFYGSLKKTVASMHASGAVWRKTNPQASPVSRALPQVEPRRVRAMPPKRIFYPVMCVLTHRWPTKDAAILNSPRRILNRQTSEMEELLAWAWQNRRIDILYTLGVILPPDFEF